MEPVRGLQAQHGGAGAGVEDQRHRLLPDAGMHEDIAIDEFEGDNLAREGRDSTKQNAEGGENRAHEGGTIAQIALRANRLCPEPRHPTGV